MRSFRGKRRVTQISNRCSGRVLNKAQTGLYGRRTCPATRTPPRLLELARKYRGCAMTEVTTEFEFWQLLKSASSSQLDELADTHNDGWVSLDFCKENQMLVAQEGKVLWS